METDRVDALLTLVREPEPPDDGFTKKVMDKVSPSRLRSFKKFITRPMILAAATLMIGTAAVAAIKTTQPLQEPIPQQDETKDQGESKTLSPRPSKSPTSDETRKESARSASEKPSPSPSSRPGGYKSSHTAYYSNGRLRIETETFTNSVKAGTPHDIVLSLQNLTDENLAVYGPKDCMLQANVYSESSEGKSQMTFCPGSSRPTKPSSEMQVVFLEPGEQIEAKIPTFFPEGGSWYVVGHCQCGERESPGEKSPSPSPSPTAEGPLVLRGNVGSAAILEPTPGYRYGRLTTPPIKMTAH